MGGAPIILRIDIRSECTEIYTSVNKREQALTGIRTRTPELSDASCSASTNEKISVQGNLLFPQASVLKPVTKSAFYCRDSGDVLNRQKTCSQLNLYQRDVYRFFPHVILAWFLISGDQRVESDR
jgi:hypothetical protein